MTLATGASLSAANVSKHRKEAVALIAKSVTAHAFHKLYVADFLDVSGTCTDKGCFFSSVFSGDLKRDLKNVAIVNRIEAQELLNAAGLSAVDTSKPADISKLALILGVDAVLGATLEWTPQAAMVEFSLYEVSSGKAVLQSRYRQELEPNFEALFPAATDISGTIFYFSGQDHISVPKCLKCPEPGYSNAARRTRTSGHVLLSVLVAADGSIHQARLVRRLEPGVDLDSFNHVRTWLLEPARDAAQHPVPVRVVVEVTFHFR